MLYTLILPYSYYREYTGVFNDSTENTTDISHVVQYTFILPQRYYTEHTGIFNDSNKDTTDIGHFVHIDTTLQFLQRACRHIQ